MNAETLMELASRVEAAAEGDSCLNREVAGTLPGGQGWRDCMGEPGYEALPFTEELEFALTLLHPAALWATGIMEDGPFARICWPQPDGSFVGGYIEATASTPALALTAAALKARAQEGK